MDIMVYFYFYKRKGTDKTDYARRLRVDGTGSDKLLNTNKFEDIMRENSYFQDFIS